MGPRNPFWRIVACRTRWLAVAGVVLLSNGTCPVGAQEMVEVEGSERPHVRYQDGKLSLNDLCPVAKRGLAAKKIPTYVNCKPIGFC